MTNMTSSIKQIKLDKYITFIKYTFQHKHSVIVCNKHGKIYKNERIFAKIHAIKGYCKPIMTIIDPEYIENRIKQCTSKIISFRCQGEDQHEYLLPNSCYNRLCSKDITLLHSKRQQIIILAKCLDLYEKIKQLTAILKY